MPEFEFQIGNGGSDEGQQDPDATEGGDKGAPSEDLSGISNLDNGPEGNNVDPADEGLGLG